MQSHCFVITRDVNTFFQTRASNDYVDPSQWKIGYTSMFTEALKVAPFKDNLWTSSVQTGNPYGRVEVNPVRQAVVALFSTGPVGVSDKYGKTNTSIVNR